MHLTTKNTILGAVIGGAFLLAGVIYTVKYTKSEPETSSPPTLINLSVRDNDRFTQTINKAEKLEELSNPYNNGGSFESYLILLSMRNQENDPETKKILSSKIKKLESLYIPHPLQMNIHTIYPNYICKQHVNCREFEPKKGFDAPNVISHLGFQHWQERAKAAAMLMDIRTAKNKDLVNTEKGKEDLFQKLVDIMNHEKENSLYAAKMAFETYKNLSNFNPASIGVLDFDKAIKNWENNKPDILKITF
ncbi:hypothetical protein KAR91_43020 [Candidatus Pacearchaeota archaeon]|nr:hypothetical protein [Candidatus Pacearchaeota archaeon]